MLLNEINNTNNKINTLYNSPKEPLILTFDNVFNEVHEIDLLWNTIKKITATENSCTILNNSFDSEKLKLDVNLQEINTYKIKELKTNPYVDEALEILKDITNYGKKHSFTR